VISEVNGVRIGIIGALDETIQSRMNPDSASDLVVTHPIKAVQASLSALSSYGVDLTILLFHADQKTTLEVARALPGLNLLISGGHTSATPEHTTTYFKLANGVHMATTPSGNGSVGYVDLSFVGEPGHLSLTGVSSHLFDARHLTPDPVVSARVDSVQRVFDTDRGRLLGKIEGVSIEGRGSAVANLMRLHTESEVGVGLATHLSGNRGPRRILSKRSESADPVR
jgi:2',3'-cyclic-nucleotide 2'-phosphodiesterase (5'-nucleotidase family)